MFQLHIHVSFLDLHVFYFILVF